MEKILYRGLFEGGPVGGARLHNGLLRGRGGLPLKLGRACLTASVRPGSTLSLGSFGSSDGPLPPQ